MTDDNNPNWHTFQPANDDQPTTKPKFLAQEVGALDTQRLSTAAEGRTRYASEFAASGDGTASNPYVDGVQPAIDDLPSDGGVVIIDGKHEHADTDGDGFAISQKNKPVVFRFTSYASESAELKLADGADVDLIELNRAYGIERGFIDGNKANQSTTCHNIVVTAEITNCWIDGNTTVSYANGDNVRIENRAWAWQWENVYIEHAANHNIHIVGPDGKFNGCYVGGGYPFAATQSGLKVDSDAQMSGSVWAGVRFQSNDGHGVELLGPSGRSRFVSCQFEQNGANGFYSETPHTQLAGGVAIQNDQHGVDLRGNGSFMSSVRAQDNSQQSAGSYDAVRVSGAFARLNGVFIEGTNHADGFDISGTEVQMSGCRARDASTNYRIGGTRVIRNGISAQSATPGSGSSGDEWGGNATLANELGVMVEDRSVSPRDFYVADNGGNWVQIG